MAIAAAAALALAAALAPATGEAQPLPSIDARTWRPSTDPMAGLVLEPAVTPGPWNFNVGAWLSYAHHPITLKRAGTDDVAYRPVASVLGADLTANVGLGKMAAFGLSAPVVVFQSGSRGLPGSVAAVDEVPHTALGDLGLHGKANIVPNDEGGFGLSALGNAYLPTGSRTSFQGDGSTRVGLRVLAEYSLLVAAVQGSVGYAMRTAHRTWPDASVGGVRFGDELPFTLGFLLRPGVLRLDKSDRQIWEVALHGWLPAGPVGPFGSGQPGSAQLSPLMLALSDRIALGHQRDVALVAGVDIGLTNAIGVPLLRGMIGLTWAPRDHDQDHDGVPDDLDQCPEIPEDRDGFEDADGCPEIDDDDDGIIDREDACPRVPGVPQPGAKNGCPASDIDGDGVFDEQDACPREKGVPTDDPRTNGCPLRDRDGDGIGDDVDRCPDQPEDRDQYEDEDGCPDPDNDGDGIRDAEDACPLEPGSPSPDPSKNGCPSSDRDGDTLENDVDQCPDAAEVFNGVNDDDGCPDEGGKPLVVIDTTDKRLPIKFAPKMALKVTGSGDALAVDPASVPLLRALALELHRHPEWTLAVGARPGAGKPADAQRDALARAQAVVSEMQRLALRENVAVVATWDNVKRQPGAAANGIGLLILTRAVPPAPHDPRAPIPPAGPQPPPLPPVPETPNPNP